MSVWRLAAILKSQATTYPTFDPTWYGPVPIVLAALEVDLAMACASLPVFWPVLQQRMPVIFVTREVQVTHSHRRLSSAENDRGKEDEGIEMQRDVSRHYRDSYVQGQVDPLTRKSAVETRVDAADGRNRGVWPKGPFT